MNKLILQDYIELEALIRNEAGDFEQQAFLLSRFFNLEINHVKKIDIKLINHMMNDMNEYINKKEIISKEEINDKIELLESKINKEDKKLENISWEELENTYNQAYPGDPITVSPGLKLQAKDEKIKRLQDQIDKHISNKGILRADNVHLRNRLEQSYRQNEKLVQENEKLTIKVEKIYSRFDLLDL